MGTAMAPVWLAVVTETSADMPDRMVSGASSMVTVAS